MLAAPRLGGRPGGDAPSHLGEPVRAALDVPPALDPQGRAGRLPVGHRSHVLDPAAERVALDDHVEALHREALLGTQLPDDVDGLGEPFRRLVAC